MKVYIGADHAGYELRLKIAAFLQRSGYEVIDEGDTRLKPDDDFPQFASRVAHAMLSSDERDPKGILICGSGQGMCIAANRFKGIRAVLCHDMHEARLARNDDDCNVLCLSGRMLKAKDAEPIISAWLNTPFAGAPRFKRRVQELDNLN